MANITRLWGLIKIPLLTTSLAITWLLPTQYATAECLIVNFKNGTSTSFDINDRPEVSFDASQMIIKSPALETAYDVETVDTFTFGLEGGVLNPILEKGEVRIVYKNSDCVEISGLDAQTPAYLHSLSGVTLAAIQADSNGTASFNLSALAKGVYIISTCNSQSFKIIEP